MSKNLVAIIGRPNVGKSTLYNRIIGKRKSIVFDEPGVTRDRLYHKVSWLNKNFTVIDTGGISTEKKPFLEDIRIQAQIAIEEAKVIVFVLDGRMEVTKEDFYIINIIRKSNKKIVIAANKTEGNKSFDTSLYTLGVDEIFPISALHGEGVGELLESIFKNFEVDDEKDNNLFKLSIIGKPNAGKSSLLNKLLNEERAIVSEIAGTTRDSINSTLLIDNEEFEIVDTAGINRKSKLVESIDHYALGRAFKSLDESNLSLLIIDATNELSHFDARIAGYAMESKKPIIIVINKWDLIKKSTNTMIEFEKRIRKEFKFMTWAPIVFISALNGNKIEKLLKEITLVKINIEREVKTTLLNEVIMEMQQMQPAPSLKGKRVNINYIKQIKGSVPTFVLFVNNVDYLHFTYKRYIENQMREYFDFRGTPISLVFRNKK
ncbi:MAG: ribosome biogenesis GTPase Der [Mycoplasmataceae bacterium]|nr:ribosome biogenesis GTPase Der [Mycoplasmataceae bacterium]